MTPARQPIPPLFVNETECARLLGISDSAWPRLRREWEKKGFPRKNPETRKYLWPAVEAWVFKDNDFQLTSSGPQDGEEHWA